MRHLVLCVLTVLMFGADPALAGPAKGPVGFWEGVVVLNGPGKNRTTYEARMTLDGKAGAIDYPGLKCGGTLSFVGQHGAAYSYRETITYGQDLCIDIGTVTVTQTKSGGLKWKWTYDVVGEATLTPVTKPVQ